MAHRTAVSFFCSCVEKTPSPWWVMLEKPYLKALVDSAEWRTREADKVELEREAWGRVRWTARRLMLAPGEGHCRSTDTHHLWAYSVTLFLSTYTPDAKTFYKIHIIKIFKCIFAFPGILCHSCCWTVNTCTQVTIENRGVQTFAVKSQIVNGSAWWMSQSPRDFEEVDAFHWDAYRGTCGLDAHLHCSTLAQLCLSRWEELSRSASDAAHPSFWRNVGGGWEVDRVLGIIFLKHLAFSSFFSLNIQMATAYVLFGYKLPKVNSCKGKKTW